MTSNLWQRLAQAHRPAAEELFADARRFSQFSRTLDDLLLDFSKTALTDETLALLVQLAEESGVLALRDSMMKGEMVNTTEQRASLHAALRADEYAKGLEHVMPEAAALREEMLKFAEACRSGEEKTADGKKFTDIVNIGIGGSDLGPKMTTAALHPYCDEELRVHFVSNVDSANFHEVVERLNPSRTLLIVSSKTFSTPETMENAQLAVQWLENNQCNPAQHIVAVTADESRAKKFGARRIFCYQEWVGGRYSVWGPVGLPLALAIGREQFEELLHGARDMDKHFCTAPPRDNIPLLLGLIGVWHRNICGYPTRAVLPYDYRLRLLPEYLQQLDMESNGKQVQRDGEQTAQATAPVVWGSAGNNAQHAYFQMLHQGTDIVPCEFIASVQGFDSRDGGENRRKLLLSNCLAQSAALFFGAPAGDDKEPHRRFAGERPSVTILQEQLTPYALGRLLAMFEHRTFTEGAIWNINSFDQWGVELGKTLAARLNQNFTAEEGGDSSTRGLLAHCCKLMK